MKRVLIYEDVARGAATVTTQLMPHVPPPAPAWCQTLAKAIVTTVNEWAKDGASEKQLIAAVADLLEEELPEVRR